MKKRPHISFSEAIGSETAIRKGINNIPIQDIIDGSVKLNQAIGGVPRSQHCKAETLDIDDTLGGLTNKPMFDFIISNLGFDQLIWEFGTKSNPDWIHMSYVNPIKNRK